MSTLHAGLCSILPYQPSFVLKELASIVTDALESAATFSRLTIVAPRACGKSMTTHALKYCLEDDGVECVVLNASTTRESLTRSLSDALLKEPSVVLVIVDDVDRAPPQLMKSYWAVFREGTFNVSDRTKVLSVFTCSSLENVKGDMGSVVEYLARH